MDGCHGSWYISISLICNEISHSLGPKGDPTLMPKYPNKCGVCMQKIPLFRCPDGQVVLGRSGASLYTYNDSVGTSQVRSFCTHLRVRDRAVNTKKQELWSRQTWFKTCLYHLLSFVPLARLPIYLPRPHWTPIFANQRLNILPTELLLWSNPWWV